MQDHLFFISTAYGITAVVVFGLIIWVLMEGQSLKKRLERAENMQQPDRHDDGQEQ